MNDVTHNLSLLLGTVIPELKLLYSRNAAGLTHEARVARVHSDERLVLVGGVLLVAVAVVVVVGRGRGRGAGRGRASRVVHRRHVAQRLADGHMGHRQHVAVRQRADVGQAAKGNAVSGDSRRRFTAGGAQAHLLRSHSTMTPSTLAVASRPARAHTWMSATAVQCACSCVVRARGGSAERLKRSASTRPDANPMSTGLGLPCSAHDVATVVTWPKRSI